MSAGQRLRQRREERQLTLRELALETRISTPVLEALERGWRDRLPEATYLRTMLPLIERHLDLEPGSLEVVLPASPAPADNRRREGLLRRFTPGSIDVFTTWQGTLVYGVLTLGLVYGLNLQQQQLAAEGLVVLRPIPPLPPEEQARQPGAEQVLLAIYPDLRPLDRAAAGRGLKLLGTGTPRQQREEARGELMVRLASPAQLRLETGRGVTTELKGASGELALEISGPWTLRLTPAPAEADAVRWNGLAVTASPGQPTTYRRPDR
ncbi:MULTISPECIES: helix-turn-helix domain-containing protein [Aphanothece]|uniref:helix-turn-helix domain-containing protein n=1 Tax=Aphanothece TaxID=1121 RepID=UPI00398F722C